MKTSLGELMRVWAVLLVLASSPAQAQDEVRADQPEQPQGFEMEEMVVTATGAPQKIAGVPNNVTVITSGDIQQATSGNIVDLLSREANVNLRGLFGSDKNAAVDVRGMGDVSSSSVVVMVDGYRMNSSSMSGPDFSSIPLDEIERIEIVRGGGSVLYGNGAVGGVINIITKKGSEKPQARAYASCGAWNTVDLRASGSGRVQKLAFALNADYYDTDGYRDNGFLEKKDAGLNAGYDLTKRLTLTAKGAYHADEYGLPGPVSLEDSRHSGLRRKTNAPDSEGESEDSLAVVGVGLDMAQWGKLSAQRGYRFRDDSYVMGYTPLKARSEQTDTINEDTRNFKIAWEGGFHTGEKQHRLQAGLDHFQCEYVREEISRSLRENSDVESLGLYASGAFALTDKLVINAGCRQDAQETRVRTDERKFFGRSRRWVNGSLEKKDWTSSALEAGAVYSPVPAASLFASCATSFRTPNTDELAAGDKNLQPQEGLHLDAGGRLGLGGVAELSATLFQIAISDEIYFDQGLQINRNYEDDTLRRGLELEAKVYPLEALYLWGNYTYMTAEFDKSGDAIPLVPEHTAGAGAEWTPVAPVLASLTASYVGEMYDGNDQTNDRFEKIDAYTVVDGKVTYKWKKARFFAGVNNIFDEMYYSSAYSETVYPMPGRSFYGGAEWRY